MTIDVDVAPASAADVYLRLHLLSHRLAAPRSINLDGVFGLLANVAWTDLGPVPPSIWTTCGSRCSATGRPTRSCAASTSSRR